MRLSRELLVLIGIVVLGSVLRALYLSEIAGDLGFSNPGVDASYHDYWARGLATGNWSATAPLDDPLIRSTPYFRPPGYPYFLALIYLLTGSSYLAARIIQMVIGIVSCLLAFHLGKKWSGSRIGLIFAGFMSVYWIFIYFEGELLEPVLLVPLGLLLMYYLTLWTERMTFGRALVTGVILGLFALVRPNILLFAPVALTWALWIAFRRKDQRRFPIMAVGLVLGAAMAISPATIRNYLMARDFVLISSNGGINLFIGNNESATGFCAGRISDLGRFETCFDYPQIVRNLEEKMGRPLKHSEVSAYFSQEAVKYMKSHPLNVLRLAGKKALLFWGPKEVGHNKEDELERIHSKVLRTIPGSFPLVLSLGAIGAAMLLLDARRGENPRKAPPPEAQRQYEIAILILLLIAAYFASHLPFFAAGRYRVPIVPFFLFFGAYGVDRIGQLVHSRKFAWSAFWLVLLVGAYGLAAGNFAGYEPDRAKWHYERGVDYTYAGQTDRAIREYSEALRVKPDFTQAHTNLGLALMEKGRVDEAVEHFSKSLRLNPSDEWAHYGMGLALAQRGKLDEAISEYRKAIRVDPHLFTAYYELGLTLLAQGKVNDAVSQFSSALRIQPDFGPAHASLGIIFEAQGKTDEAIAHYHKALRVNPDANIQYRLANALTRQGKLDKATVEYRKLVRISPNDAVAHYNLAVALDKQGKLDEAINHYSKAVRIKTDYAKAHKNLAVALYFKGRYAEAWKEVNLCRKYGGTLRPDFVKALSQKMPEPK